MKKLFVVAVMTLFGFCAHAQQTVILQNSQIQKPATASNEFYINGISSREDIGGVEASVDIERVYRYNGYRYNCYVCIKNYNGFRVTVLYMAGKDKITGSMVLDPREEKRSLFGTYVGNVNDISPAMYSVFTITRKLL